MKLLFLIPFLFVGCQGSGTGGSWTPADTAAATSAINSGFGAVNQGLQTYDRVANPQYYRPAPTVIIP